MTPSFLKPIPLPFRYAGSKAKLIRQILGLLPPHRIHCSLCGGTGAELLCKPQAAIEVYNDVNSDVCNVFRVLRAPESRRAILNMLAFTLHSQSDFRQALGVLHGGCNDPVLRAWAWVVAANLGRISTDPCLMGPGSFVYRRKPTGRNRWPRVPQYLQQVAQRFRGVQVFNEHWKSIVRRFDGPDTFFSVDPPYVLGARVSKRLYRHEFTERDHEFLLLSLRHVKGRVMLFGYPSLLYDTVLSDWRHKDIVTYCSISTRAKKPKRVTRIWMNYKV